LICWHWQSFHFVNSSLALTPATLEHSETILMSNIVFSEMYFGVSGIKSKQKLSVTLTICLWMARIGFYWSQSRILLWISSGDQVFFFQISAILAAQSRNNFYSSDWLKSVKCSFWLKNWPLTDVVFHENASNGSKRLWIRQTKFYPKLLILFSLNSDNVVLIFPAARTFWFTAQW